MSRPRFPEELLTINATSNTLAQTPMPLNSTGEPVLYDPFNKDIYLYAGAEFGSSGIGIGGELMAFSTESGKIVATNSRCKESTAD